MTPDSSKSTQQKLKEGITGTGDKVARYAPQSPPPTSHMSVNIRHSEAQPDSDKSTGQSIADKVGRSKDENVHGGTGDSILDKTKHALGMDKH